MNCRGQFLELTEKSVFKIKSAKKRFKVYIKKRCTYTAAGEKIANGNSTEKDRTKVEIFRIQNSLKPEKKAVAGT
jgi:hypothetical protein